MKTSDLFKLLSSPFLRRTLNRNPELPAQMIDMGLTEPVRKLPADRHLGLTRLPVSRSMQSPDLSRRFSGSLRKLYNSAFVG